MDKEKLLCEIDEYIHSIYECGRNKDGLYEKRQIRDAILHFAEPREKRIEELEKENAELRKVAEFQQSSNMSRHFENKKLKEGLSVGSTFNKVLNSMNKSLEEERDKYRDMVFDLQEENAELKEKLKPENCLKLLAKEGYIKFTSEQLTTAKEIISEYINILKGDTKNWKKTQEKAEQFIKDNEVEK